MLFVYNPCPFVSVDFAVKSTPVEDVTYGLDTLSLYTVLLVNILHPISVLTAVHFSYHSNKDIVFILDVPNFTFMPIVPSFVFPVI